MAVDTANMLVVHVDMVQALALAVCTYYFGVWLKHVIPVLERLSVPSPVVGGMPFAFVLSVLEGCGVMRVVFDSTLQTVLMLAFFTTIGMMASLKLIGQGGKLLLGFLVSVTVLAVLQNVLGIAVTKLLGVDFHYGLLAGSVSMMGGLGTSAAFGPNFEQLYGITGGTVVAVTAATFGMVAALVIGGPFGEWLIRKYKVRTPMTDPEIAAKLNVPEEVETDIIDEHSAEHSTFTEQLLKAGGMIAICMALGTVVSHYLGQFITLPAYIGSMIVAAIVRNIADFTGKLKIDKVGLNAVADISLVLFVTMAINSLKLHELVNLALPLVVTLICQTILMMAFAGGRHRLFDGRDGQRFGQHAGFERKVRTKPAGLADRKYRGRIPHRLDQCADYHINGADAVVRKQISDTRGCRLAAFSFGKKQRRHNVFPASLSAEQT